MMRAAHIALLLIAAGTVWAQKKDPVQWALTSEIPAAPPGTVVPLKFTATIQPGWHIYSLTIEKAPGQPAPTEVKVPQNPAVDTISIYQPKPERKRDETISLDTQMYENSAELWLPVKLAANASGEPEILVQAFMPAMSRPRVSVPTFKM